MESGFVTKDDLIPFLCSPISSSEVPLQTDSSMGGRQVKGSTRNGHHDPKYSSARRLRMARKDTGAPSESTTYAWMVADEAVGCTRAFLTLWWSSRRLVC
ncbi:uncharacterized protein TNCV_4957891 [Trichonephila clavipes]|nr:uncharacterized protein TNCV_4957891 [Trichonephila clavipes]